MRAQKSPLTGIKRLARKADRSVRTILRLVAVIAALVAGAVYWNFGTLSPCGVIREVIRERSDMADIIPDGVIDFGFETQFGEMSTNRCLAVLLENLTAPVPTTEQASQSLSTQPVVRRQGKQRSSPRFAGYLHSPFEHRHHRSNRKCKSNCSFSPAKAGCRT